MVMKGKPTIAELEAILKDDECPPIQIMPDGSIRCQNRKPKKKPKILTLDQLPGSY
jgi:hypothetical protein